MKIRLAVILLCVMTPQVFAQSSIMESQWRLSLDVIKAKAEQMVVVNNQLKVQNNNLIASVAKLRNSVNQLAQKNASLEDFLRKRAGKTDQQMQLEETNGALKARQDQIVLQQQQLKDLNNQIADWQRKINVKKLRIADWEIRKKTKEVENDFQKQLAVAQEPTPLEINELRKTLEDQKTNEAALEAKINELSRATSTKKLDANALGEENARLQDQVSMYQKEIAFRRKHQEKPGRNDKPQALIGRKKDLEEKIKAYEARIVALKNPANFTLSWDKEKKRLIRDMVQADASNQQLKSKIDNLREDIDVLRDQVGKLERRVNFGQGKGYKKE